MTYWTIQTKEVLVKLLSEGKYCPDFALSPQTHSKTYQTLLDVYNESNATSFKGLIFCIAKDDAATFKDAEDFRLYLAERTSVVRALNNGVFTLFDKDHKLVRVKTEKFESFNPCLVDFWNFIMMTIDEDGVNASSYYACRELYPPMRDVSYEDFVKISWNSMRHRKMVLPLMRSTILQANIPYLDSSMELEICDLELNQLI